MTSQPAALRATASSTANVRRNLFHHQLSRRPTSSATSTTATTLQGSLHDDSSDIVVKDRNGKYDIQVPLLPPLDEEQAQEEEVASEKEKLDARLLEMYKDRSLQPSEPAELLTAVQASLRRKVASLDDDNWMFEAEQ
ncbi:hypothetical protein ABVK25_012105 [Lepraria finkii]|uniref:Uncharacterized protein n=1 Tax=Lepraria finkii TaxID=1340010 RepID=A0ABR4AJS3_9LECA